MRSAWVRPLDFRFPRSESQTLDEARRKPVSKFP